MKAEIIFYLLGIAFILIGSHIQMMPDPEPYTLDSVVETMKWDDKTKTLRYRNEEGEWIVIDMSDLDNKPCQ